MHEADARQHLLAGEAAAGLARDAAGRDWVVGAAAPDPPLAPRVVGIALDHRAARVGDDRDRAEVILVEIAQRDGRALQEAHAHQHTNSRSGLFDRNSCWFSYRELD
jgi:hypothetical protein